MPVALAEDHVPHSVLAASNPQLDDDALRVFRHGALERLRKPAVDIRFDGKRVVVDGTRTALLTAAAGKEKGTT